MPSHNLWASQNIFAGLSNIGFSKYGHIHCKILCSGPRRQPGRQVRGGTDLAHRHHVQCPWDFLGLIKISRTSLVRKNERYLAFSPAVLKRFSRCPICVFNFFLFTFSTSDEYQNKYTSRYYYSCRSRSRSTAVLVVPAVLVSTWSVKVLYWPWATGPPVIFPNSCLAGQLPGQLSIIFLKSCSRASSRASYIISIRLLGARSRAGQLLKASRVPL
jgi:hypothetical protein